MLWLPQGGTECGVGASFEPGNPVKAAHLLCRLATFFGDAADVIGPGVTAVGRPKPLVGHRLSVGVHSG